MPHRYAVEKPEIEEPTQTLDQYRNRVDMLRKPDNETERRVSVFVFLFSEGLREHAMCRLTHFIPFIFLS